MSFVNWSVEDVYLLIYSLFLIGNYISTLKEYKKTKLLLNEMKEDELQFEIDSIPKWKLFSLRIVGAIIFKWLFFILAYLLTGNITLLIISIILVVLRIYIMYHSLSELRKTKIDLYVLIGETLYTMVFSLYYFGFVL